MIQTMARIGRRTKQTSLILLVGLLLIVLGNRYYYEILETAPRRLFDYASIDLRHDDILLIVKSGRATLRDRLERQLATFAHPVFGRTSKNTILVADHEVIAGKQRWKVHDVVKGLASVPEVLGSERFQAYKSSLTADEESSSLQSETTRVLPGTHNEGWAVDALKFIPAWSLAWLKQPGAKWFVGIDDDTFVIWKNLLMFLTLLDHEESYYLGKVVVYGGDFRFVHGGSMIITSQAAVRERFDVKGSGLDKYNVEASKICCGDVVLGLAFNETGIPADQSYSSFFSSWKPYEVAIRRDNICLPAMGLHHVESEQMEVLQSIIDAVEPSQIISWFHIFDLLLPVMPEDSDELPNWDFIGISMSQEHLLSKPAQAQPDAQGCKISCLSKSGGKPCFGWAFETTPATCWHSERVIPGVSTSNVISGLNLDLLYSLHQNCTGDEWRIIVAAAMHRKSSI